MTLSYQIISKAEQTFPDTADKTKGVRSQVAIIGALVRQIVQESEVVPADRTKRFSFCILSKRPTNSLNVHRVSLCHWRQGHKRMARVPMCPYISADMAERRITESSDYTCYCTKCCDHPDPKAIYGLGTHCRNVSKAPSHLAETVNNSRSEPS